MRIAVYMKCCAFILICLIIRTIAGMQEDNQRLANSREDGSHLVQRPFLIPSECIIPTIVIIDKVINNTNAHWSIETDQGIKLYILPKELKSTSIVFQLDNINKSKYKFKKLPFMRADGKSIALDLTEFSSGLLSSNSVKKPLKRSFLLFSIKHSASKFEEGFETCPIDALHTCWMVSDILTPAGNSSLSSTEK